YLLWVNRARQGDVQAQERVATGPEIEPICKIIYRNRIYRRGKELDDILQIARLKVLDGIGTVKKEFASVERFDAWLYTCTKNACLRSSLKDQCLSDDNIEDLGNADPSVAQSASAKLLLIE